MKFLIVDDSIVAQKMAENFLLTSTAFANVQVVLANDGQAGVDTFKAQPFDAVLSDWNMPKLNGLEFVKAVREYEAQQGVAHPCPIVMVTTEGTKSKMTEAMVAGATHYITKPFSQIQLIETLKPILLNSRR